MSPVMGSGISRSAAARVQRPSTEVIFFLEEEEREEVREEEVDDRDCEKEKRRIETSLSLPPLLRHSRRASESTTGSRACSPNANSSKKKLRDDGETEKRTAPSSINQCAPHRDCTPLPGRLWLPSRRRRPSPSSPRRGAPPGLRRSRSAPARAGRGESARRAWL